MREISKIMRRIAQYYAGVHNISQVLKLKTNVRNVPTESHKSDEMRWTERGFLYREMSTLTI